MPIDFPKALQLFNQGLKPAQIANYLGVTHQAVHFLFVKKGIIEKTNRKRGVGDVKVNETGKYPQKICDSCGALVQLKLDPLKEWNRYTAELCPKCKKFIYKPVNL